MFFSLVLYLVPLGLISSHNVRTDMATNSRKRQMWLQVCGVFTLIWFVLGVFIWPLLVFAVFSALMALIPIGVSEEERSRPRHSPEAWKSHSQ